MNRLKSYVKSENVKRREFSTKNMDITKILTYADNRATKFFEKNGFKAVDPKIAYKYKG